MEKNTQYIVVLFAVLSLVVGCLAGAVMFPTEKEVRIPSEVIYQNVTIPVEVPVEVEKDFVNLKQETVDLCFDEFLDDIDLDRYQDAVVRDVSDEFSIAFDVFKKDNRTITTIDSITFRVYDTLDENRNDFVYLCKVIDREGEDLKVTLE